MKKFALISIALMMITLVACTTIYVQPDDLSPEEQTEMPVETNQQNNAPDPVVDDAQAPDDEMDSESPQDMKEPQESEPIEQDDSIEPDEDDPVEPEEGDSSIGEVSDMGIFETTTIEGETLTQDIFADYDLTMVNVWATWCPPCVYEMPELQVLYENLPEGVNMITMVSDGNTESETAKLILDESNAKFHSLIMNDALNSTVFQIIQAFPTSFFVDNEGNYVGSPHIGIPQGGEIHEAYLTLIDETLELL